MVRFLNICITFRTSVLTLSLYRKQFNPSDVACPVLSDKVWCWLSLCCPCLCRSGLTGWVADSVCGERTSSGGLPGTGLYHWHFPHFTLVAVILLCCSNQMLGPLGLPIVSPFGLGVASLGDVSFLLTCLAFHLLKLTVPWLVSFFGTAAFEMALALKDLCDNCCAFCFVTSCVSNSESHCTSICHVY